MNPEPDLHLEKNTAGVNFYNDELTSFCKLWQNFKTQFGSIPLATVQLQQGNLKIAQVST